MFHSIYGAGRVPGFLCPLKTAGDVPGIDRRPGRALAYPGTVQSIAPSFNRALLLLAEPYPIVDRITGEQIVLGHSYSNGLLPRAHLDDWLEQVPRWPESEYRRSAYRMMAERVGKSKHNKSMNESHARENAGAELERSPV